MPGNSAGEQASGLETLTAVSPSEVELVGTVHSTKVDFGVQASNQLVGVSENSDLGDQRFTEDSTMHFSREIHNTTCSEENGQVQVTQEGVTLKEKGNDKQWHFEEETVVKECDASDRSTNSLTERATDVKWGISKEEYGCKAHAMASAAPGKVAAMSAAAGEVVASAAAGEVAVVSAAPGEAVASVAPTEEATPASAAPVEAAPPASAAPVEAPSASAAPVEAAPSASAAPVEAPSASAAPVEAAPSASAAPVEAAPSASAAPVEAAPSASAAPVEAAPSASAAPVEAAPSASAAPVEAAPSASAAPVEAASSASAAPGEVTVVAASAASGEAVVASAAPGEAAALASAAPGEAAALASAAPGEVAAAASDAPGEAAVASAAPGEVVAAASAAPGEVVAAAVAPGKATTSVAPGEVMVESAAFGEAAVSAAPGKAAVSAAPGETAVSATPGKAAVSATPGKAAVFATPGKAAVLAAPGKAAVLAAPGEAAVSAAPGEAAVTAEAGTAPAITTDASAVEMPKSSSEGYCFRITSSSTDHSQAQEICLPIERKRRRFQEPYDVPSRNSHSAIVTEGSRLKQSKCSNERLFVLSSQSQVSTGSVQCFGSGGDFECSPFQSQQMETQSDFSVEPPHGPSLNCQAFKDLSLNTDENITDIVLAPRLSPETSMSISLEPLWRSECCEILDVSKPKSEVSGGDGGKQALNPSFDRASHSSIPRSSAYSCNSNFSLGENSCLVTELRRAAVQTVLEED